MNDVESITVRKLIVAARRRGERVKDICALTLILKTWKRTLGSLSGGTTMSIFIGAYMRFLLKSILGAENVSDVG